MKRISKQVVTILLSIMLLFSVIPLGTLTASAAGGVKSKLDSVISSYPAESRWTGSFDGGTQCYGFAKLVIYNVFGKSNASGYTYRTWTYAGASTSGMNVIGSITSYSESSVKNLLSKARPGDVLQFNTSKQHSMIVYSVNSNSVTIYDCNWDNNCGIRLKECSFGTWSGRNSSKLTLLRSDNYDSVDGSSSCNCSTSYAGTYICTTSSLNLTIRSGHGSSYSSVGSIPSGAAVTVTKASGRSSSDWAHVTYNGVSGYASMQYLSKKQEHTHSYTTYLKEAEHPHRISVRCKDYDTCGSWKLTDDYAKVKTC
ncbi:MAG: SH3 domain-containing protein, partial [Faecalimonas sp.]|nr:SH3 domain-containing protein [Faecalimonas sp.]